MNDNGTKICPVCNGSGTIPGTCVCNSEWRGSQHGDNWDDCQCAREQTCHGCHGTGVENDHGQKPAPRE